MDIRPLVTKGYDLWSPIITTTSGTGFGRGTIEIENDWQLCAIPVDFGYWNSTTHMHIHDSSTVAKFKNYVLDQIDDLYGPGLIEVSNTYIGGVGQFYSYIPGSTPESSPNNFQMIYNDGIHKEVSGFWIKSLSVSSIIISWGK